MKNLMFLAIAALFLFAGCAEENLKPEPTLQASEQALELFKARAEQTILQFEKAGTFTKNPTTDSRASCNRVPICHNGNSIVVNNSAVPAHLAHGDQLTCCETSDCINESVELQNAGPFYWYYDGVGDDCYGHQHHGYTIVAIGYASGEIGTQAVIPHHGPTQYWVYSYDYIAEDFTCIEGVTLAEYECATAYIMSVIAANSCIPNLCHHH